MRRKDSTVSSSSKKSIPSLEPSVSLPLFDMAIDINHEWVNLYCFKMRYNELFPVLGFIRDIVYIERSKKVNGELQDFVYRG